MALVIATLDLEKNASEEVEQAEPHKNDEDAKVDISKRVKLPNRSCDRAHPCIECHDLHERHLKRREFSQPRQPVEVTVQLRCVLPLPSGSWKTVPRCQDALI